ncbi:MAG TPA: stage II sporulation protein M [Caulobacteraceae bacterium]|nr:stage II sporulation protein M [Caulobacteraceae bacterium]
MPERALKSQRFRNAREWDWRRLESLLRKMEGRSLATLSDEDLLAVPVLYRSALSSLSVARATSLDKALIEYLESLCTRAYFFVYGPRSSIFERLNKFFAQDLPQAAKTLWLETLISAVITAVGAVTAFLLVKRDPDWFYAFMDKGLGHGRDPSATTKFLHDTLYTKAGDDDGLSAFSMSLFTHNSGIALLAFALGFAFCAPTGFLILINGLMLGAFLAIFFTHGLGFEVVGWLSIHGTTEIFAVILAGAAGFRIGWILAFPGQDSRAQAMSKAGRAAGTLMGGVVVMLLAAGMLEGFARQLINNDAIRYIIGYSLLGLWLAYYYLPRGGRARG